MKKSFDRFCLMFAIASIILLGIYIIYIEKIDKLPLGPIIPLMFVLLILFLPPLSLVLSIILFTDKESGRIIRRSSLFLSIFAVLIQIIIIVIRLSNFSLV
jgi:drug/metabolite transporter (DMT)-like permease